jgi:hypothetical protein
MKRSAFISHSITLATFILLIFLPSFVHGQKFSLPSQIVPDKCTGQDGMCEWDDLLRLVNNFITFALYAAVAVGTYSFGWAGFMYIMSGGNSSKAEEAKKIFTKVVFGFLFTFMAWLIVEAILTGMGLKGGFSLLIQ